MNILHHDLTVAATIILALLLAIIANDFISLTICPLLFINLILNAVVNIRKLLKRRGR